MKGLIVGSLLLLAACGNHDSNGSKPAVEVARTQVPNDSIHFRWVVVDSVTRTLLTSVAFVDSMHIAEIYEKLGRGPIDSNYVVQLKDIIHGDGVSYNGQFDYQLTREDVMHIGSHPVLYFLSIGYQPKVIHLPVDTVFLRKQKHFRHA